MQHLSVRVSSLIEVVVVRRFTEDERVEVWDRWQAGDANRLIGRDLGRSAASIRAFCRIVGRGPSPTEDTVATSAVFDRTGREFSWCGCRGVVADGGSPSWSGAVDGEQETGS